MNLPELLGKLNDALGASGVTPFKFALCNVNDLALLDKNARFMTKEIFDTLVAGIERQGLSSIPFCYFDGRKYTVLSGNHRVMAAKAAGLVEIIVLYTDKELSRAEQVSIQLAHNSVVGQDDKQTLKSLWDEVAELDLKFLTGLDDAFFDVGGPLEFKAISAAPPAFMAVTLLFLPEDISKLEDTFNAVKSRLGKRGQGYAARYADFDLFFEAVLRIKESLDIQNTAAAIMEMAELTLKTYPPQEKGPEKSGPGKEKKLKAGDVSLQPRKP